jgi:hypothetical protein
MPGLLNADAPLDTIAHIIQVALTPIFLLSGIATLLNVFATRLARVADLVSQITRAMEQAEPDQSVDLSRQLLRLRWRSIALDAAVVLGAIAAAATCTSIFTLFVGALRNATVASVLFTTFGLAILCTISAIVAFTTENADGRERRTGRSGTPPVSLTRLARLTEKLGAAPLQILLRGEEILDQIESHRRTSCFDAHAMLARNIGKAAGDVRPTCEDDAFDLGADSCQHSTDVVAAIE